MYFLSRRSEAGRCQPRIYFAQISEARGKANGVHSVFDAAVNMDDFLYGQLLGLGKVLEIGAGLWGIVNW